jgi:hypothetical protein
MAFKVHALTRYNYSFDARRGTVGNMQLWGAAGLVAEVGFVDDSATVPPPTFTPDLQRAKISMKRGAFSALVDTLRNEEPVSVTINDQPPGFVFIHTGTEPVGEAER